MKKFGRIALICGLLVVAISCQPATSSNSNSNTTVTTASKVGAVTSLTASDLTTTATGGTTPTSAAELYALLAAVFNDSATGDQVESIVSDLGSALGSSTNQSASLSRTVTSKVQDAINSFTTALDAFPKNRTATFSVDLTSESFGTSLAVTKAKAEATINGTSWDGKDLDLGDDSSFNIKTLSGTALGSFEGSLTSAATATTQGAIKAATVRVSFGGDGSLAFDKIVTSTSGSASSPNVAINLDAKVATSFGTVVVVTDSTKVLSGKVIVSATSTFQLKKTILASDFSEDTLNQWLTDASTASLTITVFDLNNVQKYTKTYTSFSDLEADFPSFSSQT